MRELKTDTAPDIVRAFSQHALHDLIRVRSELDGVSRTIAHAHVRSGSCPTKYRSGDLFAALVLAGDSVNESIALIARFLDLQVVALHEPLSTLSHLDEERGTDRDADEDEDEPVAGS